MLSGMTDKYFTTWNPAATGSDSDIPDYELPLDDIVLWKNLIVGALISFTLLFISVAAALRGAYASLPPLLSAAIAITSILLSILLCPYLMYREWWKWRYLTIYIDAQSGVMFIRQAVPKRLQWLLLLASSSDDPIALGSNTFTTPQRRPWYFSALLDYNTLVFETLTIRRKVFNLNPTGLHPSTSEVEAPRTLRYIQNLAHIQCIQRRFVATTGTGQVDMLEQIRDLLAEQAERPDGGITLSNEQLEALIKQLQPTPPPPVLPQPQEEPASPPTPTFT